MSEAYRISVKLLMESNAAGVLSTLSRQFAGVHADVKKLEGGLLSLNRVKLAVFGGLGIAAGGALLQGLKAVTDQAKELNHQLAGVATMSRNTFTSIGLQGQALTTARATAASVRGTSIAGNAKLFAETYSMFGDAEAGKINRPLAMFGQVLGGITGDYDGAQEQLYKMVRAGELSGKIVDPRTHKVDTDRLMHFLDLAAKVAAATHGKVGPNEIFALAQQGAPALKGMDDDGILTMAMAAQGMGGFRSGTAAMSMFSQFAGGKMTKQVADELHKFGLVGNFHTIKGGGVQFDRGGLETDFIKSLRRDPAAGALKLQEALKKAGLNDEQVGTELFKILGRQTTQRLMADLLGNLPQMLQERERIKGADGVEGQFKKRQDQDYETNLHNVQEAWHNFMAELGLPLTYKAIGILKQVTTGLESMTKSVQGMNPDTLVLIAKGIGGLGLAMTGAGIGALILAIGPGGWLIGAIVGLSAAIATLKPEATKEALSGLMQAWTGIFSGDGKMAWAGIVKEWTGAINMLPDAVKDSASKLDTEIRSWPTKIASAIEAMGAAIVAKIRGIFTNLMSGIGGLFSHTSFGGGAGGGGGGLVRASWDGSALPVGIGAGIGHTESQATRAAFIKAYAQHIGIDPTTALRVSQSEGFYNFTGDHGMSHGDFQLYSGGGLGNIAARKGIRVGDPNDWMRQDQFALDWARTHGWHDFHGAARSGIGPHQGIGVPSRPQHVHTHVNVKVDGKTLARVVTKQIVANLRAPGSLGRFDDHGMRAEGGQSMFGA